VPDISGVEKQEHLDDEPIIRLLSTRKIKHRESNLFLVTQYTDAISKNFHPTLLSTASINIYCKNKVLFLINGDICGTICSKKNYSLERILPSWRK